MAGECTRIDVTLLADGGCRVVDNGRGIPVDPHPEYKGKSAAEIVLTMLHAGGKFGGEGYKISGGLHGVGVSVVNALSSRLDLEIHRDGGKCDAALREGRQAPGQAHARSAPSKKHGTTITFWPDATIFEETEFRAQTLIERLREMAFLNKGLEIRFRDERVDPVARADLQVRRRHRRLREAPQRVEGAAVQAGRRRITRPATTTRSTSRCSGTPATTRASTRSRTTSPPPKAGCTRRASRRPSPTWSTATPRRKGLLKEKDENLLGEDIREGLTAIVSVKLRNPQFEGQTKAKLGNTEMRSLVEKATNEKLAEWLEEHPTEAQADRRRRPTQAATRPHGGPPGARPHPAQVAARVGGDAGQARRLLVEEPRGVASCSSSRATAPAARAKRARDPRVPGDPARSAGKILNVERARLDKMLKNEEIQALITAIGAGIGDEFDLDEAPLPQDHHDGRRRRRRLAHPHAAAHVLLPPAPRDREGRATSTSRSRRCSAPTSARSAHYLKDEAALRAFEAEHDEPQDRGEPVQGSRRDGLAGARRDHDEPGDAHAAAGLGRGRRDRRRGVLDAHGRRRRVAQAASSRRTPRTCASSTSESSRRLADPTTPRRRSRARRHRSRRSSQHRADRDPGGDGTLLPRLRDVGHHRARAARRARRPEAGAPPDPLRHVRPRACGPTASTRSRRTRSAT